MRHYDPDINSIRKNENLHIFFWLLKDMSWCMEWRIVAILMIFPTLGLSIWVLYKMWDNFSERIHNLSILCWITANSYWMLSELFHFDELKSPFFKLTYEQLSFIPFFSGVIILLAYYTGIINSKTPN